MIRKSNHLPNPLTLDKLANYTLIPILHRLEIRDRLNLISTLRARRSDRMGLLREYEYATRIITRRNASGLPVAVHGDSFTLVTETGKLLSPITGNANTGDLDLLYIRGVASVSTNGSTMIAAVSHGGRVYLCDCAFEDPKLEPSFAHIVSVSTGDDHIIAVDHTGVVYCLGQNDSGQCGLPIYGNTAESNAILHARPVRFAAGVKACSVSAGLYYSLVVTEGGQLYAFGEYPGYATVDIRLVSFPDPVIIVSAAAGDEHALALTATGQVFAWGRNYHGQLGIELADDEDYQFPPMCVFDDPDPTSVFTTDMNMFTFTAVAASGDTSGALTTDGRVYVWGDLNNADCMTPYHVMFDARVHGTIHVTAISLNNKMVVCVSSDGAVIRCKFENEVTKVSLYSDLMRW